MLVETVVASASGPAGGTGQLGARGITIPADTGSHVPLLINRHAINHPGTGACSVVAGHEGATADAGNGHTASGPSSDDGAVNVAAMRRRDH